MRVWQYLLVLTLVAFSESTLNPSKNKSKSKQKAKEVLNAKSGPQESSVYERNLVVQEPLASDILTEANTYYKETSLKNFNGSVLGYVTPVSIERFSHLPNQKSNLFSGTLTVTMLPKRLAPNSTSSHRYGYRFLEKAMQNTKLEVLMTWTKAG